MAQNYVLLETIELSQSAASVTFDNLPTTGYTDLKIVMSGRSSNSGVANDSIFRFNGTSSGYSERMLRGDGSASGSFSQSGSQISWIYTTANTSTANTFFNAEIYIPNYRSSDFKSVSIDGVTENNATESYTYLVAGLWSNTSPITSIYYGTNGGSFVAGSTFSLYGIASLGTTPVTAPFATGGNIVANDGTYWYHAFLSSGTFTPLKALSCDVLVIAGGGGGGFEDGGGGGAGGVIYDDAKSVTASTTITVGAGGTGATISVNSGSGTNSLFGAMTAFGGGGGSDAATSLNGGSGGGGSGTSTQTSNDGGIGYGNVGGANNSMSYGTRNGGGGGAGTAGKANNDPSGAQNTYAGNGGDGLNTWSSWASATSTGVSGYYAGGGGGGAVDNGRGVGGAGGGGNGGQGGNSTPSGVKYVATEGIANTGGGGGGGGWRSDLSVNGRAGGSGIVLVRYPMVS
jgi:hypothetical protein